jgi:hypothetical protein
MAAAASAAAQQSAGEGKEVDYSNLPPVRFASMSRNTKHSEHRGRRKAAHGCLLAQWSVVLCSQFVRVMALSFARVL